MFHIGTYRVDRVLRVGAFRFKPEHDYAHDWGTKQRLGQCDCVSDKYIVLDLDETSYLIILDEYDHQTELDLTHYTSIVALYDNAILFIPRINTKTIDRFEKIG